MRFHQIFCFVLVLVLCFASKMCFDRVFATPNGGGSNSAVQPTENEMKTSPNVDKIILSLLSFPEQISGTRFVPKLVIWEDGRMLYGRYVQESGIANTHLRDGTEIEDLEYFWGKIDFGDAWTAEEFVERNVRSLFFPTGKKEGKNFTATCGLSYWQLYGSTGNETYTIITSGYPSRMDGEREVVVRVEGAIVDIQVPERVPLILSQHRIAQALSNEFTRFCLIWQVNTRTIRDMADAIVERHSIPVQVNVDGVQMTVLDEKDNWVVP